MPISDRRREELLSLTIAAVVAVAIAIAVISHRSAAHAPDPPDPPSPAPIALTVSNEPYARPIPPGFIGLSFEYTALAPYAGTDPRAINPVLVRLIRSLAPGQSPVLRIGGDSTDRTWAPTRALRRPRGIRFTLTSSWVAVTRTLARATHARLILGIDLEANRRTLAAAEARTLISGIGRRSIAGLELGNEPELYRSFSWYRTRAGRGVPGRPLGYDFPVFAKEFSQFGAAMPRLPLAGPAIGGQQWIRDTDPFVAAQRRLAIVTLHRYPLQQCYLPTASNLHPTIPHLLSDTASLGLAASLSGFAAFTHAHGLPLRLDELNSVSCGGAHGVSDTFASALWSLDTMFALARVGVDGVNVHTFPRAVYAPFSFTHTHGRWRASVAPEYYGLLMFARAAPPGARLLKLTSGPRPQLDAWATRAPDGRIRIVMINDSTSQARAVTVFDAGSSGAARLTRLTAPAVGARTGVTIGGQRYKPQTWTGLLTGRPQASSLIHTSQGYVVDIPAAGAAMLTLPRH